MQIKQASFLISVADSEHILRDGVVEIAIAGKSNVGKSSLINYICSQSKLARTSSEPGRTRLINYFDINKGEFRLVDLPGYGYAKVSKSEQMKWARLMEDYFATSEALKHVFVLVDLRHDVGANDKQMIAYLHHYGIPFTVIGTKADKLKRNEIIKQKKIISPSLAIGEGNIIVASAVARVGKDDIEARIEQILADDEYIDIDVSDEI
ncbi:MAG: YihA family ribosome biogenesis GTP-binding protein [Clostridia bacterium]|nr:YihA family ribosome biogenesis GTP-binding protein [Clostridia bacterium]